MMIGPIYFPDFNSNDWWSDGGIECPNTFEVAAAMICMVLAFAGIYFYWL